MLKSSRSSLRLFRPIDIKRESWLFRKIPQCLPVPGNVPGQHVSESLQEREPCRERGSGRHRKAETVKCHRSITLFEQPVADFSRCSSCNLACFLLSHSKPRSKVRADPRLEAFQPGDFHSPGDSLIGGAAIVKLLFLNVRIEYNNCLLPFPAYSKRGRHFR